MTLGCAGSADGRWVATPAGSAGRGIVTATISAPNTTAAGTLTLIVLTVSVWGRVYDVGRSAREAAVESRGEQRRDNT